jgi:hypothetical protein
VGRMPANVSLRHRAIVTAGFANYVDAVNQWAAGMYAPTAIGTALDRSREQPQTLREPAKVPATIPFLEGAYKTRGWLMEQFRTLRRYLSNSERKSIPPAVTHL